MKFRGVNNYLVCSAPPGYSVCVCVCDYLRLKGYAMLKQNGELV